MAHLDKATGPIPRDEFASLVSAPYGAAEKAIRKYDPLWGRKPGEKLKWRVKFTREVTEVGYATVEAESEKEAEELADKISDASISWDVEGWQDNGTIESVEVIP